MFQKIHLLVGILSFPVFIFAHEDKLQQLPQNYLPQQTIAESYKLNTERIAHIRPNTRESFTDLYLKDNYIYLGNSYDGIRILMHPHLPHPGKSASFPNPIPTLLAYPMTHFNYNLLVIRLSCRQI